MKQKQIARIEMNNFGFGKIFITLRIIHRWSFIGPGNKFHNSVIDVTHARVDGPGFFSCGKIVQVPVEYSSVGGVVVVACPKFVVTRTGPSGNGFHGGNDI